MTPFSSIMEFLANVFNILGVLILINTLFNIIKAFILTRNYSPTLRSSIKEFRTFNIMLFLMLFDVFFHIYLIIKFYALLNEGFIFPHDLDIMFSIAYIIPLLLIIQNIKDGTEKYRYKKIEDIDDILDKYNLKK